eukprot:GHVU01078805.1.p1 GENE.GHVU01078805.1~~GHVU01078805.1.p1  ORF type:complete len:201 (+),score=27.74 GHVU01078805.1:219-821(+)
MSSQSVDIQRKFFDHLSDSCPNVRNMLNRPIKCTAVLPNGGAAPNCSVVWRWGRLLVEMSRDSKTRYYPMHTVGGVRDYGSNKCEVRFEGAFKDESIKVEPIDIIFEFDNDAYRKGFLTGAVACMRFFEDEDNAKAAKAFVLNNLSPDEVKLMKMDSQFNIKTEQEPPATTVSEATATESEFAKASGGVKKYTKEYYYRG